MRTCVIIGCLVLLSCGDSLAKKPDNLISESKMTDVIFDLMIFHSAKSVDKRFLEFNISDPIAYIYEKHQIDSLQFTQSNTYYTYENETYTRIYDSIDQRLKRQKTALEALNKEEKRVRDSIRKSQKASLDTIKSKKNFIFEKKRLLKTAGKPQQ